MKKWKSIIAVIVVFLVIVLCGMLPGIVASVEDSFTEEMTYVDVKTMRFSNELSDIEKLYLVAYGDKVDISHENTELQYEEVIEVADKLLQPYFDTGLIVQPREMYSISCIPIFCYSNTNSRNEISGVFWLVDLVNKENSADQISLWIDESTQKIIWIRYHSKQYCYNPEMLGELAYSFYSLYMSDKEELFSAENETYVGEYDNLPYEYYVNWQFDNSIYGSVYMQFMVTCDSFEVIFYSGNDADVMQNVAW